MLAILTTHSVPCRTLLRDEKVPGPGTYEPLQDERGDNAEARAGTGGARDGDGDRIKRAIPQRHPCAPTPTLAPTLITTSTFASTLAFTSHRRPHLPPSPHTHGQVSSMRGEGATTGGYAFKSKTIRMPKSKVSGSTPVTLGPGSYTPTQTRLGENASVADMRGEEGAPAQSRALSWPPCRGKLSTPFSAACLPGCPLPTALHAGGYAFYGNSERLDVKHYVNPQTVIDMVDGAGGAHRVTY
jgi:hypothetical protein